MELLLYLPLIILIWIPLGFYLWGKHIITYWKRQNVPHIPGKLLFGNFKKMVLMQSSVADQFAELYFDKKTEDEPFIGITLMYKQMLLLKDPKLIKQILVKDFNVFYDRYSDSDPHVDKLAYYSLFLLKNPAWKEMRSRLTPTFTSGRMKEMFYLMDNIGLELNRYLMNMPLESDKKHFALEIKDICAKYTTDVIACCAFGVQANSLSDPQSEFRQMGKDIVDWTWRRALDFTGTVFFPDLIKILRLRVYPVRTANFIRKSISYVMEQREKTGTVKKDFIDALITLKNEDKQKLETKLNVVFQGDVLFAQCAVFFLAGFETSSATMSFALYEIAMQPDIQKRLRQDIKEALIKNNGELSYETVLSMEYLDMILKETLRLYPPLPYLDRKYMVPKGSKKYSLEPFGKYEMPREMAVMIPVYAMQRDPKYFPNPDKFDPERFSPENLDSINPYVYMPFGRGPHNCIGERFGTLQSKIGIINILKNHFVSPNKNTIKTMKLETNALLLQAEGGIDLNIVRDPLFVN